MLPVLGKPLDLGLTDRDPLRQDALDRLGTALVQVPGRLAPVVDLLVRQGDLGLLGPDGRLEVLEVDLPNDLRRRSARPR